MTTTANILSKKAVLASLNISRWTARALDQRVTDEVHKKHGTTSEAGRYWKRLIDKSALTDIGSAATEARNYHYHHSLPWLDTGARVLPSDLYLDYAKEMQRLRNAFNTAADEFAAAYPEYIKKAKRDLNGMFDADDYPKASEVRALFAFDFHILPCPDLGKDFRIAVGNEFVDDIRRDLEKKMGGVMEAGLAECAERITKTVGHMAEKLRAYKKPDDDKAEGTFRDSLVENVRELAGLLPSFNLFGDSKFTAVIERINEKLCAIDAGDLRDDEKARLAVAKAAESIVRDVSAYI